MTRAIAIILISSVFSGCAKDDGAYPALVPENTIVTDEALSPDPAPRLYAEADALRARAARIRAETP